MKPADLITDQDVKDYFGPLYPSYTLEKAHLWVKISKGDFQQKCEWTSTESDFNLVLFDYGLVYDGARFVLYRGEEHTDEDITHAKQYLRRNRDVVSIAVVKLN